MQNWEGSWQHGNIIGTLAGGSSQIGCPDSVGAPWLTAPVPLSAEDYLPATQPTLFATQQSMLSMPLTPWQSPGTPANRSNAHGCVSSLQDNVIRLSS